MAGKRKQMPSIGRLIIKTLAAIMLGFFCITVFLGVVGMVREAAQSGKRDTVRMLNACNRYYYEGDWASLRDTLIMYELWEEDYQKYWEITDAYLLYLDWQREEQSGLLTGSGKKAATEFEAFVANCKDEDVLRAI